MGNDIEDLVEALRVSEKVFCREFEVRCAAIGTGVSVADSHEEAALRWIKTHKHYTYFTSLTTYKVEVRAKPSRTWRAYKVQVCIKPVFKIEEV
jgi:hypothetical protein